MPVIGFLRGGLAEVSPRGEVTIDVAGVGYRVAVTPRTQELLGPVDGEVTVHVHLRVREDALSLFGFPTAAERDCFEALLGAHGVGPAMALAILAVYSPPELSHILVEGDIDALVVVPGVGPKTATRLMMELKSRLDLPEGDGAAPGGLPESVRGEVREALSALGYGAEEIRRVLPELPAEADTAGGVRAALKLLSVR